MRNFIFVLSLVVGAWMLSPTPVAQASWWSSWSWGDITQIYLIGFVGCVCFFHFIH